MGNHKDNTVSEEMDQIQQGLERFLAKEMRGYEDLRDATGKASGTINADLLPETQRQVFGSESLIRDFAEDEWAESGKDGVDEEIEDEIEDEIEENQRSSKKTPRKKKEKKRKKKSFLRRTLGRLIAIVLILCIATGVLWYGMVGKFYGAVNYVPVETVVQESMKEDDVINILLIGNDSRDAGTDGRSDAMIL